MIIKSLRIENFQSIAQLELELGVITSITGPSDSGKSSIVRALYALSANRTSDSFAHKGNLPIVVTAVCQGGTVSITRSASGVKYELVKPGERPKVFSKTEKQVPEEVQAVLGLRRYQLDKDIVLQPALQSQHGGHFLISAPDSVVSKTLGRITRFDLVFTALRRLNADHITIGQQKSAEQQTLDRELEDQRKFQGLTARDCSMKLIDSLEQNVRGLHARVAAAAGLLSSLKSAGANLAASETALESASTLLAAAGPTTAALDRSLSARRCVDQLRQAEADLCATQKKLDAAGAIAAVDIEDSRLKAGLSVLLQWSRTRVDHNEEAAKGRQLAASLTEAQAELTSVVSAASHCPLIDDPFREGCREKLLQLGARRG